MSKIRWEKRRVRNGDWWKGYIGEVMFFSVSPWDKDSREGWKLVCTLPGHAAEDMHPHEAAESAKAYCEEILKDFLKKSGLQPKPARKKDKPVPPAILRVDAFLKQRDETRGLLPPWTELKSADLKALVKLALKGARS